MTREEAIKYAEDKFDKGLYRLDLGYLNRGLYQIVAREVEFMRMAISALREQPHWISVEERLPERDEDVLMLFETGIITGGFICDSDTWCAYSDGEYYTDCSNNPTHWMPLPEPPEVEV